MTNYMNEVAKLLGVEIGEPFKITDGTQDNYKYYYKFTENAGFETSYDDGDWGKASAEILRSILIGDVRIIKLPWKPREDERYYYPLPSDKDLWGGTTWSDNNYDNIRLSRGLVFKTIDEAVTVAEKMLAITQEKNEQ